MARQIIDLPRIFVRAVEYDWDIDWAGQSAPRGLNGNDQAVINAFPRFMGNPSLVLPFDMIGHFRAIRARVRGVQNAWRVPMVDPVSNRSGGADWRSQWAAYRAGAYVEPRPMVTCTAAAAAGATTLQIDETAIRRPIAVGAYLSYADWPFIVTGRSGSGAAVTLTVEMLRTAIPLNGQIDVNARGIFIQTDGAAGNPRYSARTAAVAEMSLVEWITRS
jgi:hypothetical protein